MWKPALLFSVISAMSPPLTLGAGKLLQVLDGKQLNAEWLSSVLLAAYRNGQQPLPSTDVASLEVVMGTERLWPQSHSAQLQLDLVGKQHPAFLYLKKVIARDMPAKSAQALRRDLISNRVEARFYEEFSVELRSRGVQLLQAPLVQERLSCLDLDIQTNEDEEQLLRQGGLVLLLECVDENYTQTSPLTFEQATATLSMLADFHAAAWEDHTLLTKASDRLHSTGGYWELDRRGRPELENLKPNWDHYLKTFHSEAPDLLSKPSIRRLAERLESVAVWVSSQLKPAPTDSFATLMHGDAKAMNMFLPATGSSRKPILIDFQWTGVGFGMSDVAMHLTHSVHVSALRDGGEEQLVRLYYDSLVSTLRAPAKAVDASLKLSKPFSFEQAWHLYRLAFVDYARMVVCTFFKDASPEAFQARAQKENVGFVYRDVEASLHYLEMVDRHLEYVETSAENCERSTPRKDACVIE